MVSKDFVILACIVLNSDGQMCMLATAMTALCVAKLSFCAAKIPTWNLKAGVATFSCFYLTSLLFGETSDRPDVAFSLAHPTAWRSEEIFCVLDTENFFLMLLLTLVVSLFLIWIRGMSQMLDLCLFWGYFAQILYGAQIWSVTSLFLVLVNLYSVVVASLIYCHFELFMETFLEMSREVYIVCAFPGSNLQLQTTTTNCNLVPICTSNMNVVVYKCIY